MLKSLFKWLDINFEPVTALGLFFFMTTLVFVQVVMRFVFQSGFSWVEEFARYMFVWLIYLCVSYATRNNRHIKLTVVINLLPEPVQRILAIVSDVLFFLFSAILLYFCYLVCETTVLFGDRAVTLDVSMNILYAAGLAGFALNSIRLVQNIVWRFGHFKAPMRQFLNVNGEYSGADQMIIGTLASLVELSGSSKDR